MKLTEILVILFIAPEFVSHQMHMNTTRGFSVMLIAMGLGYIFSLPYNYYQVQKTGKIYHETPTNISM